MPLLEVRKLLFVCMKIRTCLYFDLDYFYLRLHGVQVSISFCQGYSILHLAEVLLGCGSVGLPCSFHAEASLFGKPCLLGKGL